MCEAASLARRVCLARRRAHQTQTGGASLPQHTHLVAPDAEDERRLRRQLPLAREHVARIVHGDALDEAARRREAVGQVLLVG